MDTMATPKHPQTATIETAASSRAPLPTERAFVVQLCADADPARGVVTVSPPGRIR